MDEAGIAQAVYAFWHDHGYFPRPALEADEDGDSAGLAELQQTAELGQPVKYVDRLASYVWSHFAIGYLGESKRILGALGKEELERLPGAFLEGMVEEGRSREGRKKRWERG